MPTVALGLGSSNLVFLFPILSPSVFELETPSLRFVRSRWWLLGRFFLFPIIIGFFFLADVLMSHGIWTLFHLRLKQIVRVLPSADAFFYLVYIFLFIRWLNIPVKRKYTSSVTVCFAPVCVGARAIILLQLYWRNVTCDDFFLDLSW